MASSLPTIELPINIKLDEKYYGSADQTEGIVKITAKNNLANATYTFPSVSAVGVLTNNGNGLLTWSIPEGQAINSVTVTDALTDGTFKLLQNGVGDSSIKFYTPVANYMAGIDQNANKFKISKGTMLGAGDILSLDGTTAQIERVDGTTAPSLLLIQNGVGDNSLSIHSSTSDYSLGIDATDNKFKISASNVLGTNDLISATTTGIKLGSVSNSIDISNTQMTIGLATNQTVITGTQTSIGPNSIITTGTGVNIGPTDILKTISTRVEIAKNLYLPSTSSTGAEGVINLGTNRLIMSGASNNIFLGALTGVFSSIDGASGNIGIGSHSMEMINAGVQNTCVGIYSGSRIVGGTYNTCLGAYAGYQISNGTFNVCLGFETGYNITAGNNNIAIGAYSGYSIATNSGCVYIGDSAGRNSIVDNTTYIGHNAGNTLTTSIRNTFIGAYSGSANNAISWEDFTEAPDGSDCTLVGYGAGAALGIPNNHGDENTFIGCGAGVSSTTAENNEFIGFLAGKTNTTGIENVAIGSKALMDMDGLYGNVAVGTLALGNVGYTTTTTAVGYLAGRHSHGSYSIIIGAESFSETYIDMNNSIAIGTQMFITPDNYHAIEKSTLIGDQIDIVGSETISERIAIGYKASCNVDFGCVFGRSSVLVGIRTNSPTEALDVAGNIKAGGQIKIVPMEAPASGVVGALYYDSSDNTLKLCTVAGTPGTWRTLAFV